MAFHLAEKSAVPGTRPTKSPFHRHVGSATNIATVPPPLLVIWYDPYETPPASPTPEDTVPGPRPPVSYFSDNIPSRCAIPCASFQSLSAGQPNARHSVRYAGSGCAGRLMRPHSSAARTRVESLGGPGAMPADLGPTTLGSVLVLDQD